MPAAATFTATTNYYEVLGVQKNATQEEVRKAYRKRALQTHPDRLPQNVTPEDKKHAEEQFRLVTNAYEVLNNEQNRKLYDQHGVWPPPAEQPDYARTDHRGSFNNNPFANDPFFASAFGGARARRGPGYTFTDPFELFNSLFGDVHSAFDNDPLFAGSSFFRPPFDDPFFHNSPFARDPFAHASPFASDPFFSSPFGRPGPEGAFGGSMFGSSPFGALMGGSMFPQIEGGAGRMYSSRTEAVGRNGQWVSRSQMTRTVNGRTEVIIKQTDAEGNEHITYSSPDGERYTINGIEQPSQSNRHLEGPRRSQTAPQPRHQPQAIADAPAQPANQYIPSHQQQSQAYSVPISGPAQTQAPAPPNAYLDRAHSSRSRHSSHRDRSIAEDAPRRSYTSRTSSESARHAANPRGAGHAHADRSSSRSHNVPTATPAQRIYGGHNPTANAYEAHRDSGYAHDPRRESVQSGHSHHTHKSASAARRDSREYYPEREHERERGPSTPLAPPVAEQSGQNHGQSQSHRHSQRGWRGWLSSVLHPLRHWHHDKHDHHHDHDHEHRRQPKEGPVSARL